MDSLRVFRAIVLSYFGLVVLVWIFLAWLGPTRAALIGILLSCALAAVLWFMYRRAMRAVAAARVRARAALEALAAHGMDPPQVPLERKWNASVAQRLFGSLSKLPWIHVGSGLTMNATHAGARWQFASYALPSGSPPMFIVSSYARVDLDGANISLKIAQQGVGGRVAASIGALTDLQIGDETFDKAFALAGDATLLREALDDDTRRALLALVEASPGVIRNMEIEVEEASLVLRWPGELDEALALRLRDVMLHIRGRLLDALARRAASGVRVGGFRSASDNTAEAEVAALSPSGRSSSRG